MGVCDYGIGRGSLVLNLENDGDLDILVVNQEPVLAEYPVASTTHLFRNDEPHGLASRVEIVVDGKYQIREIDGGWASYLSQNATFVHFGVGIPPKSIK